TSDRAEAFRRLRWPVSRAVSYLPVFSTIGEPAEPAVLREHPARPVIGVLSHSSEGARADLLFQALKCLRRPGRDDDHAIPCIVLLGAPGPSSAGGRYWRDLARRSGMDRHLEFTGVVAEGVLGSNLEACDLLVLLDPNGPTSRKTTLAAGLAYGMPIVALDGSDRWADLVEREAVVVVPGEPGPLALTLGGLLDSADRRRYLGCHARSFYRQHMRLELIASGMARVIEETMQGRLSTDTAVRGERRP
nr:glycosyltransferase [Actinomycetota bacterium]